MAALTIFTCLLGAFPFLMYGWGRATGSIPDHWVRVQMNNGNDPLPPWIDHWMGTFMVFSFFTLFILPIITLIAVIVLFIRQRRPVLIFQGIALMVVQWGLAFAHLAFGSLMIDY